MCIMSYKIRITHCVETHHFNYLKRWPAVITLHAPAVNLLGDKTRNIYVCSVQN